MGRFVSVDFLTDEHKAGYGQFSGEPFVPGKQLVTIRLDTDVVEWLKRSGKGYQTRINKILRTVMESQSRAEKKRAGA